MHQLHHREDDLEKRKDAPLYPSKYALLDPFFLKEAAASQT